MEKFAFRQCNECLQYVCFGLVKQYPLFETKNVSVVGYDLGYSSPVQAELYVRFFDMSRAR